MTILSQVLALLSDTGRRGQTLLSVPKHSQTSQDAAKTLGSFWHHAGPTNYTKMLRSIFGAPESRARAISEGKVSRISRSIRSTGLRFQVGGWRQGSKPLDRLVVYICCLEPFYLPDLNELRNLHPHSFSRSMWVSLITGLGHERGHWPRP